MNKGATIKIQNKKSNIWPELQFLTLSIALNYHLLLDLQHPHFGEKNLLLYARFQLTFFNNP